MNALVYHGPGNRSWDAVPDPVIQAPTDVIVRVDTATICGTDLHILKGDVPECEPGTVLGHEAVGTIVEVGSTVTSFQIGNKVLVPCVTACGRCRFCKQGRYGQCSGGGGWIFGHLINGLQAEYARVPFADTSLYEVPAGLTDEQVLFLSDIMPTSFEVGVLNGQVRPGDTVAIVGAGPIGLAAILTAKLYTPGRIVAIDLSDARLASAKEFGVDITINNGKDDAVNKVFELTGGLGADVTMEAVGVPAAFELATDLVRPRGHVGKHRRTREARNPTSREAVDSRRHDHDRAGGHLFGPAAALVDRARSSRSDQVRHPSVPDGGCDVGLRRVRRRGQHQGLEGRPPVGWFGHGADYQDGCRDKRLMSESHEENMR